MSSTVSFADKFFDGDAITHVAEAITDNPSIETLDLRGCNIRDADELAASINFCKRLRCLVLEWNCLGLSKSGLSKLVGVLSELPFLKEVDLRNNKLPASADEDLAKLLVRSRSLEKLDLRWNNLGSSSGKALLDSLVQNEVLLQLHLTGNGIKEDVLVAVDQVLSRNRELGAQDEQTRSTETDDHFQYSMNLVASDSLDVARLVTARSSSTSPTKRISNASPSPSRRPFPSDSPSDRNFSPLGAYPDRRSPTGCTSRHSGGLPLRYNRRGESSLRDSLASSEAAMPALEVLRQRLKAAEDRAEAMAAAAEAEARRRASVEGKLALMEVAVEQTSRQSEALKAALEVQQESSKGLEAERAEALRQVHDAHTKCAALEAQALTLEQHRTEAFNRLQELSVRLAQLDSEKERTELAWQQRLKSAEEQSEVYRRQLSHAEQDRAAAAQSLQLQFGEELQRRLAEYSFKVQQLEDALSAARAAAASIEEKALAEHKARLQWLQGKHEEDLERLREAHRQELSSLKTEHSLVVQKMEDTLRSVEQGVQQQLSALSRQHASHVQDMRQEHGEALQQLRRDCDAAVAKMEQKLDVARKEKEALQNTMSKGFAEHLESVRVEQAKHVAALTQRIAELENSGAQSEQAVNEAHSKHINRLKSEYAEAIERLSSKLCATEKARQVAELDASDAKVLAEGLRAQVAFLMDAIQTLQDDKTRAEVAASKKQESDRVQSEQRIANEQDLHMKLAARVKELEELSAWDKQSFQHRLAALEAKIEAEAEVHAAEVIQMRREHEQLNDQVAEAMDRAASLEEEVEMGRLREKGLVEEMKAAQRNWQEELRVKSEAVRSLQKELKACLGFVRENNEESNRKCQDLLARGEMATYQYSVD